MRLLGLCVLTFALVHLCVSQDNLDFRENLSENLDLEDIKSSDESKQEQSFDSADGSNLNRIKKSFKFPLEHFLGVGKPDDRDTAKASDVKRKINEAKNADLTKNPSESIANGVSDYVGEGTANQNNGGVSRLQRLKLTPNDLTVDAAVAQLLEDKSGRSLIQESLDKLLSSFQKREADDPIAVADDSESSFSPDEIEVSEGSHDADGLSEIESKSDAYKAQVRRGLDRLLSSINKKETTDIDNRDVEAFSGNGNSLSSEVQRNRKGSGSSSETGSSSATGNIDAKIRDLKDLMGIVSASDAKSKLVGDKSDLDLLHEIIDRYESGGRTGRSRGDTGRGSRKSSAVLVSPSASAIREPSLDEENVDDLSSLNGGRLNDTFRSRANAAGNVGPGSSARESTSGVPDSTAGSPLDTDLDRLIQEAAERAAQWVNENFDTAKKVKKAKIRGLELKRHHSKSKDDNRVTNSSECQTSAQNFLDLDPYQNLLTPSPKSANNNSDSQTDPNKQSAMQIIMQATPSDSFATPGESKSHSSSNASDSVYCNSNGVPETADSSIETKCDESVQNKDKEKDYQSVTAKGDTGGVHSPFHPQRLRVNTGSEMKKVKGTTVSSRSSQKCASTNHSPTRWCKSTKTIIHDLDPEMLRILCSKSAILNSESTTTPCASRSGTTRNLTAIAAVATSEPAGSRRQSGQSVLMSSATSVRPKKFNSSSSVVDKNAIFTEKILSQILNTTLKEAHSNGSGLHQSFGNMSKDKIDLNNLSEFFHYFVNAAEAATNTTVRNVELPMNKLEELLSVDPEFGKVATPAAECENATLNRGESLTGKLGSKKYSPERVNGGNSNKLLSHFVNLASLENEKNNKKSEKGNEKGAGSGGSAVGHADRPLAEHDREATSLTPLKALTGFLDLIRRQSGEAASSHKNLIEQSNEHARFHPADSNQTVALNVFIKAAIIPDFKNTTSQQKHGGHVEGHYHLARASALADRDRDTGIETGGTASFHSTRIDRSNIRGNTQSNAEASGAGLGSHLRDHLPDINNLLKSIIIKSRFERDAPKGYLRSLENSLKRRQEYD